MPTRHDPSSAEVLVLVFREGVLSPVGHDLKLRVTRFEIEVEESPPSVRARLDAGSLRVERAMRAGHDAGPVSDRDRAEIEGHIREILRPDRYPEIRFESITVEDRVIAGRLDLHGVARTIRFPWRSEDGRRLVEVRIDQRQFGIKPFRALLGALRVGPEVVVRVALGLTAR